MTRRILAVLLSSVAAGPALAGSAAQPGQTIGLPVGAQQLPVGLYFVNTSSFGVRDTLPRDSVEQRQSADLRLATPWNILDAAPPVLRHPAGRRLQRARGAYNSGIGQTLLAAQLAWNLGNDIGVSYLFGGYLPIETQFLTQSASLSHRFAISYTGNDLNITANMLYAASSSTPARPRGRFIPTTSTST